MIGASRFFWMCAGGESTLPKGHIRTGGDKWACPVPPDHFSNLDDLWLTLQEFMRFCNIAEPPFIKRGLFI